MDLYGWDTSYATSVEEINTALAGSTGVLDQISFEQYGVELHCELGAWRIVDGGAGELLHLEVAIEAGSLDCADAPSVCLTGLAVLLEINLRFLPTELEGQRKLGFNFQSVGPFGTPSAPGVVTPLRVIDPDERLAFVQGAILGPAIAQCLVEQASAVSFKFAEVNLISPSDSSSWLSPVECAYAYYQTAAGQAYLVVLSSTSKRDVTGLSRQIDPALFAGDGTAFFAISKALFLANAVRPLLPKIYAGTKLGHFKYDAKKAAVTNTKAIALPAVKSGLVWYHPVAKALTIKVSGSSIVTSISGTCDMYMGITCDFSITAKSSSSFSVEQASLVLTKDPKPVFNHKAHIPWYSWAAGALPGIIIAIVVPVIANGIAAGLDAGFKSMSLSSAGPLSVKWPGMKTFSVTAGRLADGFQLAGCIQK